MTFEPTTEDLEKGWKSIHSIWISMLVALFFYLLVGLFIQDMVELGIDEKTVSLIRYALYALSVITFILIGIIKKRILRSGATGRRYPHFSDNPAVGKYTTSTVVSLALAESIAIYGLALFLLGKNNLDLYILIFVSALAMIYYRPFKEELFRINNEMKGYS